KERICDGYKDLISQIEVGFYCFYDPIPAMYCGGLVRRSLWWRSRYWSPAVSCEIHDSEGQG
ncbi:MAG: hypothetical protein OEV45_15610, partial [Desulfobacteraceae bacterium]|nr:hypothetical protein [Desulfobacteraceae bacterium]